MQFAHFLNVHWMQLVWIHPYGGEKNMLILYDKRPLIQNAIEIKAWMSNYIPLFKWL